MAVWSIIKKSELEGAKRIDSEYYRTDFIEAEKILKKINLIKLNQKNAFITDGQHGYFKLDPKSEIRQITAQHIKDGFIHKESADRLSSDTHKKNLRASLQFEDVVLSTVGSVGNAGIVTKDIPPANLDQNVARIHLKIKNLDPYFLTVFFLSKYGKSQIQRNITGQVQQRLSLGAVRELDVPLLKDQKTISYLLKQCHYMFMLSKKFYSKAEQILLEELGLKDLDLRDDLFYTTTLKEIKNNNRMDAEYYISKYEKLEKHIQSNFQIKLFKDVFKIDRGDYISPDYYMKKAKRAYIRIKELTNNGSITDQDIIKVDDNFKNIKLKTLKEGDFVFAAIGATLGKVNRISSKYENSFFSNNTARFRLKKEFADYNTYFVEALLRSPICQLEFERRKAQTAQAKISNDEIGRIFLPLVRKEIQFKVAKYIEASYKKNTKAKNLLEQAKHKVEEMIEKEAGVK